MNKMLCYVYSISDEISYKELSLHQLAKEIELVGYRYILLG